MFETGCLQVVGPSKVMSNHSDGGDYAIVNEDGHIIGEAIHRVSEKVYLDAKANAQLWATSHRLLDACENLVIAIGMGWDLDGVVEVAQEVIAEARGEAK
ncbi:hypothetical protein Rctr71_057 [Virus Rctr71]|nr:hypothetical protein Rctr71_057 [Virus Rctr71]